MRITPNVYNTEPQTKTPSVNYQKAYTATASTAAAAMPQKNIAFGSLKSGFSKWLSNIANRGFFTEFLILDTLSMISPRVWIGLNRDKEKTGHYNYKAGAEEAGREVFSGPSIFLIPMAIMTAYKHFKPASHMPHESLHTFTNTMKELTNEITPEALKNKAELDKKLAEKMYNKAFGDFKLEENAKLKSEFIDILTSEKSKDKNKAFNNLIETINKSNKIEAPNDSKIIKLGEKVKLDAAEFYDDFHCYSKDITAKLTKQNFASEVAQNAKKGATEFLETITKSRGRAKVANALLGFFAVGAFLMYLPKLTQLDKTSPAMESAKRAQEEAQAEIGGANENK